MGTIIHIHVLVSAVDIYTATCIHNKLGPYLKYLSMKLPYNTTEKYVRRSFHNKLINHTRTALKCTLH